MKFMNDTVENYLLRLQKNICQTLNQFEETTAFQVDNWSRPNGSGGKTCILSEGKVFEKVGVNFSHVHGESLPPAATSKHPELAGRPFHATGVSLVIHPLNPYVPTTHCNVRFFMASGDNNLPIWWFGGGFDLTPYYGFIEDCIHWHTVAKEACFSFGEDVYPRYKHCADEYFYLPHRAEHRGIGGLFFDDLHDDPFEKSFAFMQSVGDHFLKAYIPILERRYQIPYGKPERDFQAYRRGRYAEFNLIYDRGTRFGLQYGGRTESILMSLPPSVSWRYNWQPEAGSREAELTEYFLKPRDWLSKAKL